jgi:hypothetical protein
VKIHRTRAFLFAAVLGTGVMLAFGWPAPPTAYCPLPTDAWGFFGHRKINHQAVFTLPPEMMVFFKKNIDYLTEHAVDPDKRRYATVHEAPRHYLDLDRYGEPPFPTLPRRWTDALLCRTGYYFVNENNDTLALVESDLSSLFNIPESEIALNPALFSGEPEKVTYQRFRRFFIHNISPQYYEDEWVVNCDSLAALSGAGAIHCTSAFAVDTFSAHGILPYNLVKMLDRLTRAFVEKDEKKILRYAADTGHYIADAHVPLHTSKNYNGQFTNQLGIHAFWESRIPELFAERDYDFWVGKAGLIEYPEPYFWDIVLNTNTYVDSVLTIEQEVVTQISADRQFCSEQRGSALVRTQCEEFAAAYHERLGGMVERQMRAAIVAVGSAWFTAWIKAGQPDLSNLTPGGDDTEPAPTARAGKPFGRKHE